MPTLSSMEFNADQENAYRRGYTHGVEAVLLAVKGILTDEQKFLLRTWSTGPLLDWSSKSAWGLFPASYSPANGRPPENFDSDRPIATTVQRPWSTKASYTPGCTT